MACIWHVAILQGVNDDGVALPEIALACDILILGVQEKTAIVRFRIVLINMQRPKEAALGEALLDSPPP